MGKEVVRLTWKKSTVSCFGQGTLAVLGCEAGVLAMTYRVDHDAEDVPHQTS